MTCIELPVLNITISVQKPYLEHKGSAMRHALFSLYSIRLIYLIPDKRCY